MLPIGATCSGQVDQACQYKLTNARLRKACTNITLKDYELVFYLQTNFIFPCDHERSVQNRIIIGSDLSI